MRGKHERWGMECDFFFFSKQLTYHSVVLDPIALKGPYDAFLYFLMYLDCSDDGC